MDTTPFIPLDKSWLIRMGVLDLRFGSDLTLRFLVQPPTKLSDDLKVLMNASLSFPKKDREVNVGESGTLFRFLLFLSWTMGQERKFIREGTLKSRQVTLDPSIVKLPIEELLTLDSGTSQWASAAVLCRDDEPMLKDAPHKLLLTYEALAHWMERRRSGQAWSPRYDGTIQKQAEACVVVCRGEAAAFAPEHSEDYCFARAFGLINAKKGQEKWPSLAGHESNRLLEMEEALSEAARGEPISSGDHRVVQAVAMLGKARQKKLSFRNPKCTSKSWPMFWDFLEKIEA